MSLIEQPWGLGLGPAKFRAYLAAELGERQAELATVAPGRQGERTDKETSHIRCGKSGRKAEQLRAILRAPELVQQLYRDGLIRQADAAPLPGGLGTDVETLRPGRTSTGPREVAHQEL